MKIILVTSQINYCPLNYDPVLRNIVNDSALDIAGVIIVKINMRYIYRQLIFLKLLACNNIFRALSENIYSSRQKRKESIFAEKNIPIFFTDDINSDDTVKWIRDSNCDLLFNLRTRSIFKEEIFTLPRLGCINIHHGLLPEQKGLFCDLFAIGSGKESGFTIHEMTKVIDHGLIYHREIVEKNCDYMQYLERLAEAESKAIDNFIHEISILHKLPRGNVCTYIKPTTTTTTPTLRQVRELQRKGIIL